MHARTPLFALALLSATNAALRAQQTPWQDWTLLPAAVVDEIVGEASGETAWNTIVATGGFNRDRLAAEYEGTFHEAQYVLEQLRHYGLAEAQIVRFPGGPTWDGVVGELWEVAPGRAKLASYQDLRAMLASGSESCDVTAELVWVGGGSREELERADVAGKIVVTDGSMGGTHRAACGELEAAGVVCVGNGRALVDPLQIPWSGIGRRRGGDEAAGGFGFFLPPREGALLERRLREGQHITVRARVESTTREVDLEDVVCAVPGTDPDAGEVILSAHLFEGYVKQGANDNLSGSAAILEIARTLHTLVEEGRIPRPRRTIRFLWGPEFSGTGPWVKANRELMERTLCDINLDMVGESLGLNRAFFCLMRTTFGNPHYVNDVVESYYRFVGEGSRERIQNRGGSSKVVRRIVAPSGVDEPFYYSIETHYGASDHEVFNDWGVGVPGVMMIAWPDLWYHTSGDRPDKADPTQLKRVAVIGAAAAYTIAAAGEDEAARIASEIASNATRRLGHQLLRGLEELNAAEADGLPEAYRRARAFVSATCRNEVATLASVLELAPGEARLAAHVARVQETVEAVAAAQDAALEAHMQVVAAGLGVPAVRPNRSELERRAAGIVPRPTALVRAEGYGGYREALEKVPAEAREKLPFGRGIASTSELQRLVDGRNSALDIRDMLDAQHRQASDLQEVLNYLEVLELAGLVEL